MTRIIVTDLTRFRNPDFVCTAGVTDEGTVIRPMPYLKIRKCRELNVSPGAILVARFRSLREAPPHTEDASYRRLCSCGRCTRDDFHQTLERTVFAGLSDGFATEIETGQKCIPVETPPPRSLITIKIPPFQFELAGDRFDGTKLKVHLTDNCGLRMSYLGLTDREFHGYAQKHAMTENDVANINRLIHSQDELYLRIGLSRAYRANDGRHGYWMQVNGIYTFPDPLLASLGNP